MVGSAESETRQGNSRWLWILDRIAGPALASASRAERARVLSLGGTLLVGIASFISFLERTSAYRQDLRRAEYGDERDADMRAIFERIDPTANADKIRSALDAA